MKTIMLVAALFMVSCSSPSDGERRKRDTPREELPHYMKDIVRVDSSYDPGTMYRMENDEVICYMHGNDTLACHWKSNEK